MHKVLQTEKKRVVTLQEGTPKHTKIKEVRTPKYHKVKHLYHVR